MKKLSTINRNDILLGAGLLFIALCLWCVIFFVQKNRGQDGLTVVVTVDGEEYCSELLWGENAGGNIGKNLGDSDRAEEYNSQLQQSKRKEIDIDGHNKIVIANGEVWMEEADCPDKLCISQGKISRSGQTIICLPNKVMVTIKGGKSEYDGVAQ